MRRMRNVAIADHVEEEQEAIVFLRLRFVLCCQLQASKQVTKTTAK